MHNYCEKNNIRVVLILCTDFQYTFSDIWWRVLDFELLSYINLTWFFPRITLLTLKPAFNNYRLNDSRLYTNICIVIDGCYL